MTALARIFSALVLILSLVLAGLWIYPQLSPPPSSQPPLVGSIDRIVVEKAARQMVVYQGDAAVKTYTISLGSQPIGAKQRQGDGRTPEGVFTIDRKNAASAFHLSLGISYPTTDDVKRARAGGYDAGGDIMIHGQPNGLPEHKVMPTDWTAGCIAISNADIEEIFAATTVGTRVIIKP
jgi:murein L,D-transpeptidase YafK